MTVLKMLVLVFPLLGIALLLRNRRRQKMIWDYLDLSGSDLPPTAVIVHLARWRFKVYWRQCRVSLRVFTLRVEFPDREYIPAEIRQRRLEVLQRAVKVEAFTIENPRHVSAVKARMHAFAAGLKQKAVEQGWTSLDQIPESGQRLLKFFKHAFQDDPRALAEAFRGIMFAQSRGQSGHYATEFMGRVLLEPRQG